jgi:hypothetical protein
MLVLGSPIRCVDSKKTEETDDIDETTTDTGEYDDREEESLDDDDDDDDDYDGSKKKSPPEPKNSYLPVYEDFMSSGGARERREEAEEEGGGSRSTKLSDSSRIERLEKLLTQLVEGRPQAGTKSPELAPEEEKSGNEKIRGKEKKDQQEANIAIKGTSGSVAKKKTGKGPQSFLNKKLERLVKQSSVFSESLRELAHQINS